MTPNIHILPSLLREAPFSLSKAKKNGLTQYHLKQLIYQGVIEEMGRGIYRASNNDISDEDMFRIATVRVGTTSAICLVSALAHFNLTDTIPKKTWIMVPDAKRTTDRTLKLLRSRNPNWKTGIEKRDGYKITSIDRTIVDCFIYQSKTGSRIGLDALKRAITLKKTTLGKVMEMAVKLKASHRIQPYVEALS